ncbi:MAG: sarcosine oxidase subunit delta [Gammaproteobacteria bacterium]|jgi:sarcosine oxidase subunit delta|nr:sarcosine oxidase subunit delta [Gammaproteobacteria bacterium]MBT5202450.1 sarcosine oxidase subunit delta [Gammaproteobacteria bacterium]MBT6246988.1 sarcosine oxidase subunit delta [Gammaproteobacteria bacterium]
MKQLRCPLNGLRNISEFIYGGEYHDVPDYRSCSSRDWSEHVFFAENKAGWVIEWWCHLPTSYWFLVERNTVSDEIRRSFPSSDLYQERVDFSRALAREKQSE